jgi:hypothetical protein
MKLRRNFEEDDKVGDLWEETKFIVEDNYKGMDALFKELDSYE